MSYRNNYLDLDPTYNDPLGRPLLRHDVRLSRQRAQDVELPDRRGDEIAKAMGAKTTQVNRRNGPYSIVPYQTTHNTGGAIMGNDPKTSVVNRYLQCWDVLERVRDGRLGVSRRTPATTRPARSAR